MGNVRMRAEQINYGASNVKVALDDLDPKDLIALSARMDTIEAWKATVKAEEKTGASVEYTNALALAAVSLSAEIVASQDLHGLPFPYVGGAYKNKLPNNLVDGTIDDITYTKLNDDGINIDGTSTGGAIREIAKIPFPNGSYIISKGSSNALFGITVEAYNDDTWVKVLAQSYSTDDVSFTVDNDGYNNIRVTIRTESGRTADNIVFYPMIRLASVSDTTFAPWSNICPISGRTETSVLDHGKNICPNIEQGGRNANGTKYATTDRGRSAEIVPAKAETYCITAKSISGKTVNVAYLLWANTDSTGGTNEKLYDSGWKNDGATFTLSSDSNISFVVRYSDNSTIDVNDLQIMVEVGSTATAYEPYKSTSATIQLGQTVYGGEVDFNEGIAKVTDGYIASYDGETLPSTWISDRDVYAEGTTPTTGAEVVYKLATPTTIQLTPTQLTMLKGYNRLSSDGGGDITVKAYTGAPWGGDEA